MRTSTMGAFVTTAIDLPEGKVRHRRRSVHRVRAAWVTGAAFAVGGVVLFFAYLGEARTRPTMSDGSSQALQAWAMLHGNVVLHGWSLSDVSFYTTELPQYMLIELVKGLRPDI